MGKNKKNGETLSWLGAVMEEDGSLFAELSGDKGEHHFVRDEQGRLMTHGLLTATLPTKIGGDLNLIARELTFRFHRPVFVGDTIECVVTLTSAEPGDGFVNVVSEWK